MSLFKKAVKAESKLRLAIAGPSGSGKTFTALSIATALSAGPVALVDTEHGSASKYAGLFEFDVAEMNPPFHPDKFIRAIQEAQSAGYAVLIIDSISHAWSGTGGVLDLVDEAAKRSKSGNTYMAWKEGTPVQNRLIDAIVQSGIHIIATMRSKTEYVLVDVGNGKQAPRKVGMAPVQRDQFEYEFDVVFDMDIENNAIVSKTRCPALTGRVFAKPGQDVAVILREWLSDGAPADEHPQHRQAASADAGDGLIQSLDEVPEMNPDGDNPFTGAEPAKPAKPVISKTDLNTLHALGVAYYGTEWDTKRAALVEHATKGASKSSAELMPAEGVKLIGGLEKRIRQEYAEIAQAAGEATDGIGELAGVKLAKALTELRARVQVEAA